MSLEKLTQSSDGQNPEAEYPFPLREILSAIWRRMWILALSIVVCVGGALGFSFVQPPQYEATTLILVGQENTDPASSSSLASDVQGLEQLTQTVTELLPTETVATAAVEEQGLQITEEELLSNLSAEQVPETQVVEVTYTSGSAEQASGVANAVGEVFENQVSDISPATNAITARVWQQAEAPDVPASPNPVQYSLLALAAGIIVGLGLIFLLERLDNSWRSPEELENMSGVPNLGAIRRFRPVKKKHQQQE